MKCGSANWPVYPSNGEWSRRNALIRPYPSVGLATGRARLAGKRCRSRSEEARISSTAASKASALAGAGARKPLILRTNWSAAARTSSSVAGAVPRSVLMLRHIHTKDTTSSVNLGIGLDRRGLARRSSRRAPERAPATRFVDPELPLRGSRLLAVARTKTQLSACLGDRPPLVRHKRRHRVLGKRIRL